MPTTTTSLTEQIAHVIADIGHRRAEIKEEFIKAWLASTVPTDHLNLDWLIQNVELVEQWSDDRRTVTWQMRMKPGVDKP